ncbi:MAG: MerR family transcriptional regulator [Gluconacetobacter diazotrophicus]|nr:MerR family transcriptional regulator [Gluconacetobacter diazotrophicus]
MVRFQDGAAHSIASLAAAAGVGVETVRFYQRRGLLPVPDRASGGRRRYGGDVLRRLRFIRAAQAAGFTLREIAELLDLDRGEDRVRALDLARARLAALDEEIAALQRSRDALRMLAAACGAGTAGPCPILSAFDAEDPLGSPPRRR